MVDSHSVSAPFGAYSRPHCGQRHSSRGGSAISSSTGRSTRGVRACDGVPCARPRFFRFGASPAGLLSAVFPSPPPGPLRLRHRLRSCRRTASSSTCGSASAADPVPVPAPAPAAPSPAPAANSSGPRASRSVPVPAAPFPAAAARTLPPPMPFRTACQPGNQNKPSLAQPPCNHHPGERYGWTSADSRIA